MNFLLIIFTVILFTYTEAEKRLRISIKQANLWSDNKILNYTEIFDESEPTFTFEFKLLKQLSDADFHIEATIQHKDNHKYNVQFNATYSICRILSYKSASPLAGLMFNHLKSFGNIPDDCPIKPDTYGIKKFVMGDHTSKLNLPEVEIDVHIQAFITKNNEIIKILDNTYKAETNYKEVAGESKRAGGLLSMLG